MLPPRPHCPPVDLGGSRQLEQYPPPPPLSTAWTVSCLNAQCHPLILLVCLSAFLNRSAGRSRIPTPRSGIPRRPGSTTPGAKPSTPGRGLRPAPPRAQSVDPYKMASQSMSAASMSNLRKVTSSGRSPASKIKRPSSSRYIVGVVSRRGPT